MYRISERWLASALLAGLVLAAASTAQSPEESPKGTARAAPIRVDDIVERIMAFDKNKDGKVTKDELPERMHHLIELGDTNTDGALDQVEIRKLAIKLAATPEGFGGRQAPVLTVSGPGAPGGVGIGGAFRFAPDAIEGVVDDLKLPATKRDQAMAAVKVHQENVRKLMDQARAELLEKMKVILSEEEFNDFKAALDRPRGATFFRVGPGPRDPSKGGGQEKLDRPQK
jgi:hypothetical protein